MDRHMDEAFSPNPFFVMCVGAVTTLMYSGLEQAGWTSSPSQPPLQQPDWSPSAASSFLVPSTTGPQPTQPASTFEPSVLSALLMILSSIFNSLSGQAHALIETYGGPVAMYLASATIILWPFILHFWVMPWMSQFVTLYRRVTLSGPFAGWAALALANDTVRILEDRLEDLRLTTTQQLAEEKGNGKVRVSNLETEIGQLELKLGGLRSDKGRYHGQVSTLEAELRKLRSQLDQQEADERAAARSLADATRDLRNVERELVSTQMKLKDQRKISSGYHSEMRQRTSELEHSQVGAARLRTQLSELKLALGELRARGDDTEERKRLQAQVTTLQFQLQDTEEQVEQRQLSLRQAEERNARFIAEIRRLQQNKSSFDKIMLHKRKQIHDLQVKLDSARRDGKIIATLESQLGDAVTKHTSIMDELVEAEERSKALEHQYVNAQAAKFAAQASAQSAVKDAARQLREMQALQTRNERLEAETQSAARDLQTANEKVQSTSGEGDHLRRLLDSAQAEVKTLTADVDALNHRLDTASAKVQAAREEKSALTRDLQSANATISELNVDAKRSLIASETVQKATNEEAAQQLRLRDDALSQRDQTIQELHQRLQEAQTNREEEVNRLRAKVQEVQANWEQEGNRLRADNQMRAHAVSEMLDAKNSAEAELQSKADRIEELQKNVAKLMQDYDALSTMAQTELQRLEAEKVQQDAEKAQLQAQLDTFDDIMKEPIDTSTNQADSNNLVGNVSNAPEPAQALEQTSTQDPLTQDPPIQGPPVPPTQYPPPQQTASDAGQSGRGNRPIRQVTLRRRERQFRMGRTGTAGGNTSELPAGNLSTTPGNDMIHPGLDLLAILSAAGGTSEQMEGDTSGGLDEGASSLGFELPTNLEDWDGIDLDLGDFDFSIPGYDFATDTAQAGPSESAAPQGDQLDEGSRQLQDETGTHVHLSLSEEEFLSSDSGDDDASLDSAGGLQGEGYRQKTKERLQALRQLQREYIEEQERSRDEAERERRPPTQAELEEEDNFKINLVED